MITLICRRQINMFPFYIVLMINEFRNQIRY